MTDRRGAVWYGERRVGSLREDGRGVLHFAYDSDWLHDGSFPISVHLPLANGDRDTEAHVFFEGLLPEGRVRQRICRQLGIAVEDDTGLLLAIGEDCAGALSVLPEAVAPGEEREPPCALTSQQMERLIRSHGEDAAAVTGVPQRFSLAGAQEKQPVIFYGRSYALPDRANPSTHILKFETVPRVCVAEFAGHDMARRLGLPVAATELLGTGNDGTPFLRVERYDRSRDASGAVRRLHQEDVMQALGLPGWLKYQKDGGPSLADVAALLREHTARPAEALARLRDWQMFNCLAGNWDGHGKNLALLYLPDQPAPVLAPFYDLVAIEFLNHVRPGSWARDLAFSIGGSYVPERVTKADWEAFSSELRMPARRVLERLADLAGRMPELAAEAREALAREHGDERVFDALEESVRRRCRWTLRSVFGHA